jgi:hypothetical protein
MGTYEHSVIDMVGRGIRTLIPVSSKSFIPQEIVDDLSLPTFTNQEELTKIIKEPINQMEWNNKIKLMTEMDEVVKIIDKTFQTIMKGN